MNVAFVELVAAAIIILLGALQAFGKISLEGLLGRSGATLCEQHRRTVSRVSGTLLLFWGGGVGLAGALHLFYQKSDSSLDVDFIAVVLVFGGLAATTATLLIVMSVLHREGHSMRCLSADRPDRARRNPGYFVSAR